jgi:hypothetical protein
MFKSTELFTYRVEFMMSFGLGPADLYSGDIIILPTEDSSIPILKPAVESHRQVLNVPRYRRIGDVATAAQEDVSSPNNTVANEDRAPLCRLSGWAHVGVHFIQRYRKRKMVCKKWGIYDHEKVCSTTITDLEIV